MLQGSAPNPRPYLKAVLATCLLAELLPLSCAWTTDASSQRPSTKATTTRRLLLQSCIIGGTPLLSVLSAPPAFAKNLPDRVQVDTSKAGTKEALVPVLQLQESMKNLQAAVETKDASAVTSIQKGIPANEQQFKAIFDAYSDPVSYKQKFVDQNAFLVYYSKGFDGVGRPSIESDLPVKQTLQYGARNDAWIAWQDVCIELDYQRKNPHDDDNASSDADDAEELSRLIQKAIAAIDTYLEVSNDVSR